MPRPLAVRGARVALPLLGLLAAAACASAQTPPAAPAAPAQATAAPAAPAQATPAQATPAGAARDSSASPRPSADSPAWLVSDDGAQTVTIALQVTRAPDGTVLLNGRRNGEPQIVVPLGWTVQWDWRNADSAATHSLVVMAEREKLPTEGGHPAFTNAMTRMVSAGLEAGEGDRTTFTAEEPGWYWLLCGVSGHAIAGEFLGLRVDPDAKTASVKAK